jgi:hypothetical protein
MSERHEAKARRPGAVGAWARHYLHRKLDAALGLTVVVVLLVACLCVLPALPLVLIQRLGWIPSGVGWLGVLGSMTALLVAGCFLLAFFTDRLGRSSARRFQRLSDVLEDGEVLTELDLTGIFAGYQPDHSVRIAGRWAGRPARVELGSGAGLLVALQVGPNAWPLGRLHMEDPTLAGVLEALRGGKVGFTAKYRLGKAEQGRALLLEAELDALLALGFASLELNDAGELVADRPLDLASTQATPATVRGALGALERIARAIERTPLRIEATAAGAAAALAWTDGGGDPLCPYCRAALTSGEALPLAACNRCDTSHHEACLEEAGVCTVFGCGSTDFRRVHLRKAEEA